MPLVHSIRLREELAAVEDNLIRVLHSRQTLLTQAARKLVLSGGKRIRPTLTLLGATFGCRRDPAVVKIAAAIELLHMATLVHDDIIDASPLRRGKPTVQAAHGNEIAVFTGDWLLTKAMLLLAETKSAADRLQELARAMIHICEGEVSQLTSRHQRVSVYDYLRRIHGKTASLFGLSLAIGAEHNGATTAQVRHLTKYGIFIGMAFQIYDDLLDYTAELKQLGKPVGTDIQQGIYTLPLIFALANKEDAPDLERLLAISENRPTAAILALVAETDALERCRNLMQRYLEKAVSALDKLPETPAKADLVALPQRLFSH